MADQQILAVLRSARAAFNYRTRLDGTIYRFRFVWNIRNHLWLMDIRQSDDTPILLGVQVVVGTDLLGPFDNALLPPGQLFAVDTLNEGVSPGRNDLRGRTQMVYRPVADLASHVGLATEIF